MIKYIAKSLDEMPFIAKEILKKLSYNKPLFLNGPIGSGKTTLTKYIAKELNITEVVNSPTFVIMKIYSNLIHIDAYRINGTLEEYYDYFDDGKYIIIEWSNNINHDFKHYLKVDISLENGSHIFKIVEDK